MTDRVIAVLLGGADQLLGAPLDRPLAQAWVAREQPLHSGVVAGHRGPISSSPDRAPRTRPRRSMGTRCPCGRSVPPPGSVSGPIDRVIHLVALGIHPAGEEPADPAGEPVTGGGDQCPRASSPVSLAAPPSRRRHGPPCPCVVAALKRLTEAGVAIVQGDGGGWRTDFGAIRRGAGV